MTSRWRKLRVLHSRWRSRGLLRLRSHERVERLGLVDGESLDVADVQRPELAQLAQLLDEIRDQVDADFGRHLEDRDGVLVQRFAREQAAGQPAMQLDELHAGDLEQLPGIRRAPEALDDQARAERSDSGGEARNALGQRG